MNKTKIVLFVILKLYELCKFLGITILVFITVLGLLYGITIIDKYIYVKAIFGCIFGLMALLLIGICAWEWLKELYHDNMFKVERMIYYKEKEKDKSWFQIYKEYIR